MRSMNPWSEKHRQILRSLNGLDVMSSTCSSGSTQPCSPRRWLCTSGTCRHRDHHFRPPSPSVWTAIWGPRVIQIEHVTTVAGLTSRRVGDAGGARAPNDGSISPLRQRPAKLWNALTRGIHPWCAGAAASSVHHQATQRPYEEKSTASGATRAAAQRSPVVAAAVLEIRSGPRSRCTRALTSCEARAKAQRGGAADVDIATSADAKEVESCRRAA